MFDIFATILSAGVVISVVTLVVHEPLLLAAGITTLLGLMFLMLPVFVPMVPALGYLLIFTGLILLVYGVLSTRSWLNTLNARRVEALARRRALYGARGKDDDDSDLRRAGRLTSLVAPPPPAPAESHTTAGAGDPPPLRENAEPARPATRAESRAGGALARVGRGLRDTGAASRSAGDRPTGDRPAGRSASRELDYDEDRFDRIAPPPPPAPAPVTVAPPPPVQPVAAVKAPAKPLSRGAERIERIKAESRRPPRSRAAAPAAPVAPPAVPTPVAVPPAVAAVAPSENRARRRTQDLMELGLLDLETDSSEGETPKAVPQPAAKPFVSRLARRG